MEPLSHSVFGVPLAVAQVQEDKALYTRTSDSVKQKTSLLSMMLVLLTLRETLEIKMDL